MQISTCDLPKLQITLCSIKVNLEARGVYDMPIIIIII
jgi:hypothetical protein